MDNRPHSRDKKQATGGGGVNKRGNGINSGKPAGNMSYGNRKVSSGGGGGTATRAGGLGAIAIVFYLVSQFLFPSSSSTTTQTTTQIPTTNTTHTQTTTQSIWPSSYQPTVSTQSYETVNSSEVDLGVVAGVRKPFTTLKGKGKDEVTVLVYMCATDLEANYGMATKDINEMAYATQSDKVHVLLETGGTSKWKNSTMNAKSNERWDVSNKALIPLDRNLGARNMTEVDTLADFIKWGAETYPADRYILVLWDHGSGSVKGYGYDMKYPNGSMTVDEISTALKKGGVKFDIVGFDACLMANVETALAVSPYADYLIASEETEPGTGWYYTSWLSELAKNTSIPTTSLGKVIIDDFITDSLKSDSRANVTLSLVDLGEFIHEVPSTIKDFSNELKQTIKDEEYTTISKARDGTKEFGSSSKLDQIDLVHFCKNLNTTEAKDLAKSIQSCVKYNRSQNLKNAYGLSIYFPYRTNFNKTGMSKIYDSIGMETSYVDAIRNFSSVASGGQVYNQQTSTSIFDLLGGASQSSQSTSGYDSSSIFDILSQFSGATQTSSQSSYQSSQSSVSGYDLISSMLGGATQNSSSGNSMLDLVSTILSQRSVDNSHLTITNNGVQNVISLSEDDWATIQDVLLNVWVDDGEGYIDLGCDNYFEFDSNGNLIMDYDGTWMGINDHIVSYYFRSQEYASNDDYTIKGYIPCLINDTRADLIIEFTAENNYGIVVGAQQLYETEVLGKGYMELQDGDEIKFIADYYSYNQEFIDSYDIGSLIYDSSKGLEVTTYQISGESLKYGYILRDIYQADHMTEMLDYQS